MENKKPTTLQEAIIYFADFENCKEFMVEVTWPDGKVVCPKCGSVKVTYLANARVWKCYQKHLGAKFSLKTGTIFEDSPIGLEKWLPAVWMLVNAKNGISSYEIHRALGVTQKTAWFMMHRIRLAMQSGSFRKLGGNGKEVEVDETLIGGKARNMHLAIHQRRITGTGGKDKTSVMGILERKGNVRTVVIANRRKTLLQQHVRNHVATGTALYTDALRSYEGMAQDYTHNVIDHAKAYVNGRVHTNGLENFWSLLKRGIKGTYVSIEPFHLFRYLDEQTFRYNNRKEMNDADRFEVALGNIVGKRLTYSELTGKEGLSPAF